MNTKELLAARPRQTTQRMTIPVDADTTRRLRAVIAGDAGLPWWRRLLRWMKQK